MAQMSESEFNQLVDDTLIAIEEALDDSASDLDYENNGGVLTIEFDNGSQIIINRQTPTRQIWVATRAGGFHFDYDADNEQWVLDTDGTPLLTLLSRAVNNQSGGMVDLVAKV